MIKGALIFLTAIALVVAVGIVFAVNYVPSPFTAITLRGDAVVATVRPDMRFLVFRAGSHTLESAPGSEPLEMRDGESVKLQSPHTGYKVICRTSPSPAGLYVEGEWHLHDFPKSFVKKWFMTAH
jgi:hypothetical protein